MKGMKNQSFKAFYVYLIFFLSEKAGGEVKLRFLKKISSISIYYNPPFPTQTKKLT